MAIDHTISAYCLGELDGEARSQFEARLLASAALQAEVRRVQELIGMMRELPRWADGHVVSARLRGALGRVPEEAGRASAPAAGVVRRVTGLLRSMLDSDQMVPGFRGSSTDRQWKFESEVGAVFVKVETLGPSERLIVGRYEGAGDAWEVVASSGSSRRTAPVDALGFFELPVFVGAWSLTLSLADADLELPVIEVDEQS